MMRVGAYIDGLNLYYGGRHLCGRGTPGWRWLDVPKLVELLVSRNKDWIEQQAVVHRIAYCSAMIDSVPDTQSPQPLGTVNPRGTPTAQALRGRPDDGASGHWWYSLTAEDFFSCQLSDAVGEHRKPAGW